MMFKYFRGFTDSMGAFYIYIDVSKDFVGSGSEDERGRVWDRYSEHDMGGGVDILILSIRTAPDLV